MQRVITRYIALNQQDRVIAQRLCSYPYRMSDQLLKMLTRHCSMAYPPDTIPAMNTTPLKQLTYLALDCQTTGNNPQNDHLLELGWSVFTLSEGATPDGGQSYVFQLPEDVTLSKRIQKLTGIAQTDLEKAVDARDVIDAFIKCAQDVARQNGLPSCPTVIHYARFEMGFLQNALAKLDMPDRMPIEVICTHQVATRLMPQLPRKGLRAVAGYLGHSVPESKRCSSHLQATQWVWRHMVHQLADQAAVKTLGQLRHWLNASPKPNIPKRYPMPDAIRKTLPDDPGIYRMKRSNGDVLYIGKAANLKQRVSSYFHQSRRHPEHVLEMLTQAKDLEVTPAMTALEAALEESDAIKQDNPPYNIALVRSHRSIVYLSRNFEEKALKLQKGCPLGPVSSSEPFAAAYALGKRIQMPNSESKIEAVLAMPLAYCPDVPIFDAGFSLFRQRHGHLFEKGPIEHAVMRIGRLSWLQKLEAKNAIDESQSMDEPEEESVEFVWTPEAVVNALESVCRQCGFLLRRARWLRILGNAQVVWQMKAGATQGLRGLIIEKGAVVKRMRIKSLKALSPLPSSGSVRMDLAASMDLETYDRLRVLTTEIRRLVAEDRLIGIRLGTRAHLYPEQLRRLLRWI